MKKMYKTLELNKNTHIYETTPEYNEAYSNYAKSDFRPYDEREYKSLKIMFHKKLPKYRWNNRALCHISKAYNGAGFTLVNQNYILNNNKKKELNIYDINSAYQHTLIKDDYVLSSKYKIYDFVLKDISFDKLFKKFRNKKFICYVEFRNLLPKYDYVDYNIFEKQLNVKMYKHKITKIGWLCDVDLRNVLRLYNYTEYKIYYLYHFFKKIRKNYKTMLHIATYGKSAQHNKHNKSKRSKYSIIAIYQSAYVRNRMINIFLKYKNAVAYIDTDSVFLNAEVKPDFQIGNKIGQFKLEYQKVKAYINRMKAYILYKNKKRLDFKWSGLQTQLNESQIKNIENGKIIEINEKRAGKNKKFKIYNKYLIGDYISL